MALVCMMMVSFGDKKHNGHEYVDLGLSVKWATCNVGATTPEGYGDYFSWGETSPKVEYIEDNCTTYKRLNDISGNAEYDAATVNWGGNWRMPTYDELEELGNNCIWTWITQNGVNGYNVEGPSGSSIFLPAAGGRYGSSLDNAGSSGGFWCSTPCGSCGVYGAYALYNHSDYHCVIDCDRCVGIPVRPVVE